MKKTVAIVACLALAAAAFVSCSKSGASAKDESLKKVMDKKGAAA